MNWFDLVWDFWYSTPQRFIEFQLCAVTIICCEHTKEKNIPGPWETENSAMDTYTSSSIS